jgi:hypothetical protein
MFILGKGLVKVIAVSEPLAGENKMTVSEVILNLGKQGYLVSGWS